jgi:iron complex transport system substrate-binding protein
LYLTPRTLDEIDENILDVGEAIGRGAEAARIVDHNRARVREWRFAAARRTHRPRVTFLEWTDPPFCAGHWVPEMIELAGGVDRLARPGADSVRVSWDDIRAWNPEVVIVAPCGFGLADAERLARDLPPLGDACIVPVDDANAFFARPGPRYVEGIEVLSRAIRQLDAI